MRVEVLLASVLLAGCVAPRARVEYGIGKPALVGALLNSEGSGRPLDNHFSRISVGDEIWSKGDLKLECFAGAWNAAPEEHESSLAWGLSVAPRLSFGEFLGARPFFSVDLGMALARWEGQGTDFEFLVGGGPGLLYEFSDSCHVTVGYSLFHLSNAGIDQPNPGRNSDLLLVGFEFPF